jgi:enamine deaminase RidA (YjgF/YER057c/UK114 family)
MSVEARLRELGVILPPPRVPVGHYVSATTSGSLVFTAGQGSAVGSDAVVGTLGRDLEIGDGYRATKLCALNCLAAIEAVVGSLERVEAIVSIRGFVRSTPDFTSHPAVMDGASDLLIALFGTSGHHARSAIGVNSLPNGYAAEIEIVARIRED